MNDRELMQQALDLLDDINQCSLPPTGIPLPAEIDHVMEDLRARLAQPEQEPVACVDTLGRLLWMRNKSFYPTVPIALYTAPPQREWQGLTDEDKAVIYRQADEEGWHDQPLLEAVEAKLKEKNK